MIYIFNSGYRPRYRTNVLNTLFLPKGYVNEFRYSVTGEVRHVHPTFLDAIKNISRGEKVAIIFIDRFAPNGYIYHPIRLGKFLRYRITDQRLYILVELSDFIYPSDIERFNSNTRKPLELKGSPKITNSDPECTNDGFYAILEDDIFLPEGEYIHGENAWTAIVKSLEKTRAFVSTESDSIIFLRADLQKPNGHNLSPSIQDNNARFAIQRNNQYDLWLTYRYPLQGVDKTKVVTAEITVDVPSFQIIGDSIISIDSVGNSISTLFTTKKYPEVIYGNLEIKFQAGVSSADTVIGLKITEPKYLWPMTIVSLLIFSFLSVIIGADLTKIQPLTFISIIINLWPKLIAALVQAIILCILFIMFGKKIL